MTERVNDFELRSFQVSDADAVWKLHDAALEDAGCESEAANA